MFTQANNLTQHLLSICSSPAYIFTVDVRHHISSLPITCCVIISIVFYQYQIGLSRHGDDRAKSNIDARNPDFSYMDLVTKWDSNSSARSESFISRSAISMPPWCKSFLKGVHDYGIGIHLPTLHDLTPPFVVTKLLRHSHSPDELHRHWVNYYRIWYQVGGVGPEIQPFNTRAF